MTILTRKFSKIFLLKLSYKAHVSNLMMHFQDEMTRLFFLQNKAKVLIFLPTTEVLTILIIFVLFFIDYSLNNSHIFCYLSLKGD